MISYEEFTKQEAKLENATLEERKAFYADILKKEPEKTGVRVRDCYEKWMRLAESGVDTTALLANAINHPTREMHWLFANALLEELLR